MTSQCREALRGELGWLPQPKRKPARGAFTGIQKFRLSELPHLLECQSFT